MVLLPIKLPLALRASGNLIGNNTKVKQLDLHTGRLSNSLLSCY